MGFKRIAFISVHTSPLAPMGGKKTGGMNVYIRELSQELGKQGFYIDIFTRRSSAHEPEIDYGIGENVRVIYLNAGPLASLTPDEHYPHLPEFTASLIAYATRQNIQYDVIYSHYWLSGWVAAKLKEAWGIKVVHMFHTLGHMKRRIKDNRFYSPDTRIMTEALVIDWADRIVAATPAEQAQLLWLYRADRRKIEIIPPGVNTAHFQNAMPPHEAGELLGLNPKSKMLLFVGRIEPLKAIDTIFEALYVMREKSPKLLRNLRFTIVGGDLTDTKDNEMQRLQDMSVEFGIDHMVCFVGAKEQSQLPIYYSAATAVIMPSDYESFGMVALEAMATGTPVIASQVGGLAFLVRDKETGFHIPAREPKSLADCIITLLSDKHQTQEMGILASHVAKDYAWSSIAGRLLQVFADVTAKMPCTV
jgi:D-inositol-3-phosphate glycosyltransferase